MNEENIEWGLDFDKSQQCFRFRFLDSTNLQSVNSLQFSLFNIKRWYSDEIIEHNLEMAEDIKDCVLSYGNMEKITFGCWTAIDDFTFLLDTEENQFYGFTENSAFLLWGTSIFSNSDWSVGLAYSSCMEFFRNYW